MIDEKILKVEEAFGNIADRIRENYLSEKSTTQYKPSEMPQAIDDMANDIQDVLYNYLPTKKVTDGLCENAVSLPVKEIGVDGNNEHKTTNGYQLLNIKNKKITLNGITAICENGVITLDGINNATEKFNMVFPLNADIILGEIYSFLPIGRDKTKYDYYIVNSNYTYQFYNSPLSNVISEMQEYNLISLNLEIMPGATFNNDILKPLLVSGTYYENNFPDFEPYTGGQASPNPSYTQDIEVIDMVNLLNPNDIVVINSMKLSVANVKPNTNYYIKAYNKTGTYTGTFSYYAYINGNWKYQSSIKLLDGYALTTPNGCTKVGFNGFDKIDERIGQLSKGTTEKPYLSYGCIGLEQSGKNKFDEVWENGGINSSNGSNENNNELKRVRTKNHINILPNNNYVISFDLSNVSTRGARIILYDENKNFTRVLWYDTSYKNNWFFNSNSNEKYVRFTANNDLENWNLSNIQGMLEEGTTATPYEPYHEPKVYPINLNGHSIARVEDIKDKLRIYRSGKVELLKKRNRYVFTGEESGWISDSSRHRFYNLYTNLGISKKPTNAITNYFTQTNTETSIGFTLGSTQMFFRLDNEMTDVNQFKQFLSQQYNAVTPVYVDYDLETPQTIALPSIEPIQLWKGTNNFKLITNLDTTFEVEYVVDIESIEAVLASVLGGDTNE